MAKSNKKLFSLRLPLDTAATIETYAQANNVSKSQALLHYVQLGMQAETGAAPVTKADLVALVKVLETSLSKLQVETHETALPSPQTSQKRPENSPKQKPLIKRIIERFKSSP